jgi:polar amino acid transport system substrate-binding protein
MKQVIQYQKDGTISVEELPAPQCIKGGILVRNLSSVISAGTEKTSVTNTQSSLVSRARKQPKEVKMVMDFVKKEGLVSTAKRVFAKLDSYKTFGYSTAGIVIESDCEEFLPGDFVACGGAGYAVHAEIITVPKNLAVKVPSGLDADEAAYATVGSIALQGVRQADVRLGENVAVIGLGLLGQMTVQMLKASGCNVAGLDINDKLFDKAKSFGCDETYISSKDNIKNLLAFTKGNGFDAVILTASTSSNEPMELAIEIARKKGSVVVVGSVGMNIPRSPFYQKELKITISCSYGPGRYDANYEELGIDYPVAFVRWTENRNMQAVLEMIAQNKLDVKSLTTHTFNINDATKAYELVSGTIKEFYLGIVLNYPERKEARARTIQVGGEYSKTEKVSLGFLGAGTFAQNYLLPPLKETKVQLHSVSTAGSVNAMTVAKRFGFVNAGTDSKAIINNPEVNAIFCATRHDLHSEFVVAAVNAGKPVFVEKPLAVNIKQLTEIDKAVADNNGRVMVGFNRRFSKPFSDIKDFFSARKDPLTMSYRVNAGMPPKTFWVFRPEQGGGRVIGEACHFIDTMCYLTGAVPVKVYAECISSDNDSVFNHDNVVITIKFSDGSVGSLQYFANGDSSLPKEYCEVHCEASSAIMDNFEMVRFYRNSKQTKKSYNGKKGHNEEVFATIKSMKEGKSFPIEYETIRKVTLATFAAIESLKTGYAVELKD